MRKIAAAVFALTLALPCMTPGQVGGGGGMDPDIQVGAPGLDPASGIEEFVFRASDMLAMYTFGRSLELNPTAEVFDGPANLLLNSEDMTGTGWIMRGTASAVDASHVSLPGNLDRFDQGDTVTVAGVVYTIYMRGRISSGSASGIVWQDPEVSIGLTGSVADYVVQHTGDGVARFGLKASSPSALVVEVLRFMLIPGTYTAAEAAAIYEKTIDRQAITDWSGNGATLQRGSTANADTNDPSGLVASYNKLAPGSSDNLENAAWVATGTPVTATTTVQDDDAAGYEAIDVTVTPTVNGARYLWSVWVKKDTVAAATRFPMFHAIVDGSYEVRLDTSTGATTEAAGISGTKSITSESIGGNDYWKLVIGFIADDALGVKARIYPSRGANVNLSSPSSSAVGTITILKQQLEQVPAGTTTPLPYRSAASPVYQCSSCDLTTDDVLISTVALSTDWTFYAVLRPDDVTSAGLFRNGTSSPNVSIDANGKVSYAGGSTVAATNAITAGLWHVIAITKVGNTITHYLDGAANGSGTSSSGNAFTGLRIGYDGTTYMDGSVATFTADDSGHSARTVYGNGSCSASSTASDSTLLRQCGVMGKLAYEMWQERRICVTGYRSFCTE